MSAAGQWHWNGTEWVWATAPARRMSAGVKTLITLACILMSLVIASILFGACIGVLRGIDRAQCIEKVKHDYPDSEFSQSIHEAAC